MDRPDFACAQTLNSDDLRFVLSHFPGSVRDPVEAVRRLHEAPSTLDNLLDSSFLQRAILDSAELELPLSPALVFNVLLRAQLTGRRSADERETINYLAHLLALFARSERLHRIHPGDPRQYEYLVDLVLEAAQAVGERQFLIHSHIGNYALFIAGLRAEWVAHRQRYRRRPLSLSYYCDMGRSFYGSAAVHELAERFSLRRVFRQLSERFDYYRAGLEGLGQKHLFASTG